MRERLERMLGRTARAIWILTFHAACGRILRREAERLGYRSTFTIYDQADQVRARQGVPRGARQGPEALHAARDPRPDLEREEPADLARGVRLARRLVLGPDRRRGVRALPAQALRLERGRLRRHADAHRPGARAVPGGARALAVDVPPRPRRRVPGHEPRPVPPAPASRREAPERVRGRRPRSVDLCVSRRRHPQHPRLRARLRRRRRRRARAELPLDERDPRGRERGDRQQPRPQAEAALVGARTGRSRRGRRGRGRARRGALRRGRDRAAGRVRQRPRPRSRSSTGRTRSRACSRTCSSGRASRTR